MTMLQQILEMGQIDDEMLGKTMHMAVGWSWDISFIFQSWSVKEDETISIIIGLLLTVALSALSVITPSLKSKVAQLFFKKHNSNSLLIKQTESDIADDQNQAPIPHTLAENLFNFVYIFLYSLLHIGTMMLMMTYNGYVIIAVILGLTIGSTISPMQEDKDKNLPINCCA